ncbi:MAG: Fibronectin type III protein [Parcubacteria group bacterium Gr01-1014_38]|nr:MAG: Fibronectin type III protein [Parcubacteria group bacterium Gr01-1014_38]
MLNVAAFVAVVAATLTAASTALLAAAALPGGFVSLPQSLFPFLALHRPRRSWGRIVEERTNLPVAGAVVTILDMSGKPRETVSSRSDGTFGALLPRGSYQLSMQHTDFAFTSAPEGVVLFPEERLYTGGFLRVEDEEQMVPALSLVIGMRPTRVRRQVLRGAFRSFLERLRVLQARLALPVLLTGAAINSVALVLNPTPLLVSYEILYGVFLTFELLLSRVARRALGRVRDAVTRSRVGLAVVRLMDMKTRRLVETRVTSSRGSFLLMPPPGRYRLQVAHAAYTPYTSDLLRIGRGRTSAVRLNVDLEPGSMAGAQAI